MVQLLTRGLAFASLLFVLASPVAAQTDHMAVIVGPRAIPSSQAVRALGLDAGRCGDRRMGIPKDRIIYLAERPEDDAKRATGKSTQAEITRAFANLAKSATPEDVVFVVLIGHGTFDGQVAKFNLPGPDMTAADFAPS